MDPITNHGRTDTNTDPGSRPATHMTQTVNALHTITDASELDELVVSNRLVLADFAAD